MAKKKATEAVIVDAPKPEQVILAFKGFDSNMQCRGYQFEIGKTYIHDGKVEACESGFHACENPLDVWSYYALGESKICTVELSGELSRHSVDSKIAAGKITIKAEIGIPTIVTAAIAWMMALCKDAKDGDAASGYSSKQAASGYYSTQAASGDYSTQAASGYYSTQAASGDYSTQAASGYSSKQAASGYSSKQAASGKNAVIVAAGCNAKAKASEGGCFALRWDDPIRPRIAVAYVGENGIKPDVFYTLDKAGEFVESQS